MDPDYLVDLFTPFGEVSCRKMFGGIGVYHQSLIFALIFEDDLYLKTDKQTDALYEEAGCKPWTYENKSGKMVTMPYWTLPESAIDDTDELVKWSTIAFDAALRSQKAKPKPKPKKK